MVNASISMISSIATSILSFVVRTVFIKILGEQYLGLNGVFTGLLSVLSLVELGVGPSIVFFLYKPLAEKNEVRIKSLLRLYRQLYRIIGFAIGGLGIGVLPLLPRIVGDTSFSQNVTLYYLLFLANSVVSYFFAYNRSLLIADQRGYIVTVYTLISQVALTIVQISLLATLANFSAYLIAQVVFTLSTNIVITQKVRRSYDFLRSSAVSTVPLDKETKAQMKKLAVGNFSNQVGWITITGVGNILIAVYVNLVAVGIYSNYSLIITVLQTITIAASTSVTASIGNVAVTDRGDQGLSVYRNHQFMNFVLVFFGSLLFIGIVNPFIVIWVGESYVLNQWIVLLIGTNYFLTRLRNSSNVFISAYGLAWKLIPKSFIETFINLSICLILLKVTDLGIVAVVLASIITSSLIATPYEAYVAFRFGLKTKLSVFYHQYLIFVAAYIIGAGLISGFILIIQSFAWTNISIFILRTLASFVITLATFLLLFSRTVQFAYFTKLVQKYFVRKRDAS